jgi:hypothetical protein
MQEAPGAPAAGGRERTIHRDDGHYNQREGLREAYRIQVAPLLRGDEAPRTVPAAEGPRKHPPGGRTITLQCTLMATIRNLSIAELADLAPMVEGFAGWKWSTCVRERER